MRLLVIYLIGLVFGVGISISGMANPAKVLNFFDVAGSWDPSLILVMGGALAVAAIGYQITFRTRSAPVFTRKFNVPSSRTIDARLVGGSAVFGIGWGIAGFCPGGALPALGTGDVNVFIFFAALVGGIFLAKFFMQIRSRRISAVAAQ